MKNVFGKFILFLLLVALIFNAPSRNDAMHGSYEQMSKIHEESSEENTIILVIITVVIVILVIWIFTEPNHKQTLGG